MKVDSRQKMVNGVYRDRLQLKGLEKHGSYTEHDTVISLSEVRALALATFGGIFFLSLLISSFLSCYIFGDELYFSP
jgi:hypothetical protein